MRLSGNLGQALPAVLIAVGVAGGACAQQYPTKPIRIVAPFGAGGLVDVLARAAGEKLRASLGQPIIVDNRPGSGGNIGADIVAKETADGGAGSARLGAWMRPGSGL
jgi:tripartite-type tricarboxylate transporter receptor subunit TctC